MAFWNRTKSFEAATSRETHSALKPTLSWVHLVGLGVGGIVGTGIYTLTGVGAGMAGPAVILSFVDRRHRLRRCGARVRRNGDDDADGRQCVHVHVRRARRVARLDRRLDADPRIHRRLQRRRGRLVRLRGRRDPLGGLAGAGGVARPDRRRWTDQPAGDRDLARRRRVARDSARARARRSTWYWWREAGRARDLHRDRAAGFQRRQLRAVRAVRLWLGRDRGRHEARRDGRGGDHLLRVLRFRRGVDRRRRNQESQARPEDRHHRLDGPVHVAVHGRRRCRARQHELPGPRQAAPSRWRWSCAR